MHTIHFQTFADPSTLPGIPAACDTTHVRPISEVSHNIFNSERRHARKQARPKRAIKKDSQTQFPAVTTTESGRAQRSGPAAFIHSTKNFSAFFLKTDKPSAQTAFVDTFSQTTDPVWTHDQNALLLNFVKSHKGSKPKSFWSKTSRLFGSSRTPEACRKKYF